MMYHNVKRIEKAEKKLEKAEKKIHKHEKHADRYERKIEKAERKLIRNHPRLGEMYYASMPPPPPLNPISIATPPPPPPPPARRAYTPPPRSSPVGGVPYASGYGQPPSYTSLMGAGAGASYAGAYGGPQLFPSPHANLYGPMAIFKPYDRDGDGMITENDFIIAMRENGMGYIGDEIARDAFRKYDRNRNGRLDMHEAVKALKYLRPGYY